MSRQKLESNGRQGRLLRSIVLLAAVFTATWLCASYPAAAEEATVGVEARHPRAEHDTLPLAPPQLLSVERIPDTAGTAETPPVRSGRRPTVVGGETKTHEVVRIREEPVRR